MNGKLFRVKLREEAGVEKSALRLKAYSRQYSLRRLISQRMSR